MLFLIFKKYLFAGKEFAVFTTQFDEVADRIEIHCQKSSITKKIINPRTTIYFNYIRLYICWYL